MWSYPTSKEMTYLIIIEPRYNPYKIQDFYGFPLKGWIVNMITHWTIAFEIAIVLAAATVFGVRATKISNE
jgi:hypothetical protein